MGRYISLILVCYLFGSELFAQSNDPNGWNLKKNHNGIKVYSRMTDESKFKEIRVTCEIEGTLDQLFTFLSDIENYKNVVYITKDAYMIQKVNDREFYYYSETAMPWPIKNRDLVVHLTFEPRADTRQLLISAENSEGLKPRFGHAVRIPYWRSVWNVRKKDPGHLAIDYVFRVDPGGELPVWLINMTAEMGPYNSFVNLEKTLRLPRYQDKSYPFLNF